MTRPPKCYARLRVRDYSVTNLRRRCFLADSLSVIAAVIIGTIVIRDGQAGESDSRGENNRRDRKLGAGSERSETDGKQIVVCKGWILKREELKSDACRPRQLR